MKLLLLLMILLSSCSKDFYKTEMKDYEPNYISIQDSTGTYSVEFIDSVIKNAFKD